MKNTLLSVMALALMASTTQAQVCKTYKDVGTTSDAVYGSNNGGNDNTPNFTNVSKIVTDGGNAVTATFTRDKMVGYRDNRLFVSNARKFRLWHRNASDTANSTVPDPNPSEADEFQYTMALSSIPANHNARVTLSQYTTTPGQVANNEYSTYTISWVGGSGNATVYDEAASTDVTTLYAAGAHTGFDVNEKQIEGLATGDTVANGGSFNVYHVANTNAEWRVEFPIGVTSVTVNKKVIVIDPAAGGYGTLADGYTIDPNNIMPVGSPLNAPTNPFLDNAANGKGGNYPAYGANWADGVSKWGTGGKVGESFNEVMTLGVELVECTTEAEDDIYQTPKNTPVNGNILTNDSDSANQTVQSATYLDASGATQPLPLGTATTVYDASGAEAGQMTLNANGTYTFTPATDYTGTVPVDYTVLDTNGKSDSAKITIEVLPTPNSNDNPPVAQNDTATVEQNESVTTSVLANDSHVDGETLSIVSGSVTGLNATGQPVVLTGTLQDVYDENGNLAGQASVNETTGEITFTANSTYTGNVPIQYTVTDTDKDGNSNANGNDRDEATLTITVRPQNNANKTYANDDANTGYQGEEQTGNIFTNDRDPEGDTFTVTRIDTDGDGIPDTLPTAGTPVTITDASGTTLGALTLDPATGAYTWAPAPDFVGTAPIVYEITDQNGNPAKDNATLYLTTLPKPATISGTVQADTTGDGNGDAGLAGVTVTLKNADGSTVTDVNGNPLTTTTSDGTTDVDGDGTIDPAGSYYFDNVPAGDYTIETTDLPGYISISDGDATPDTDTTANTNTNDNSIPVSVKSGENDTGNNFVDSQPVTIEGTVLKDDDGNGATTAFKNVTVTLVDANGDAVLDNDGNPITATTDANGKYSLTNIPAAPAGTYQIKLANPVGYSALGDADGGTDRTIAVAATTPGSTVTSQDFQEQLASLNPVTLVQFSAVKSDSNVLLSWTTASEDNNEKFVIEYSLNGVDFTQLTEVEGNGTTSSTSNYSAVHKNIAKQNVNNVYYRLSQIDYDGNFEYVGDIVRISFSDNTNLAVYPVPAQAGETVTITGAENMGNYKVFNTASQMILEGNNTSNSLSINTSLLSSGIYIIQFENGKTAQFIVD